MKKTIILLTLLISGGMLAFTSCSKDQAAPGSPKEAGVVQAGAVANNSKAVQGSSAGKSEETSRTIALSEDLFEALKKGDIIASVLEGDQYRAVGSVGTSQQELTWTSPYFSDWCRIPTLRMQAYISLHWAQWKTEANNFGTTINRMVSDPDCPNSTITIQIPPDHPGVCPVCDQPYTGYFTAELVFAEE
jgi:hypothetical protein